jgi:hypothetical protein
VHRRLDLAYTTLMDAAKRKEYDAELFPDGVPMPSQAVPIAPGGVDHGPRAERVEAPVTRPPMPTIDADTEYTGPFLRRMREAQGIELRELAERSKIGVAYLTALEADDFLKLPAPVYVRGFLGEYARMLGLDPERVKDSYLDRYRSARGDPRDADGNQPPRRRARPTPAD